MPDSTVDRAHITPNSELDKISTPMNPKVLTAPQTRFRKRPASPDEVPGSTKQWRLVSNLLPTNTDRPTSVKAEFLKFAEKHDGYTANLEKKLKLERDQNEELRERYRFDMAAYKGQVEGLRGEMKSLKEQLERARGYNARREAGLSDQPDPDRED